tara:strand:- start:172 stop:357 length:186 start_codon:yes stop_codon:yes gene_type:complete
MFNISEEIPVVDRHTYSKPRFLAGDHRLCVGQLSDYGLEQFDVSLSLFHAGIRDERLRKDP